MRNIFHLALLLAATLALPTCKPDTAKTATNTAARNPAAPAEVRAQFDILRDSADADWQRMMTSDDHKIADIKALLAALGKQPRVNVAPLETLHLTANRLPTLRYTRQTMAESALIDRYDAAQDSVLHQLYPLAAPGGNAPTAKIRDYVEAIQQADASAVSYRAHYDRAAKAYNTYLQVHQETLNQLGGQYAGLQPLPLFELSK